MYEDMANLTYLNEASILYNLRSRYVKMMIYVSTAGCLCIRHVVCRASCVEYNTCIHIHVHVQV